MKGGFRCIFPKVYRIPADCVNKSIFKNCLAEPLQKVLRHVAESKVTYLSPFDSAAILTRLLENTNKEGVFELRRDPLYRPVVTKIVDSIQLYRRELLYYFIIKFYKLHDTRAIKILTRVFVDKQATQVQNINQLIELLYYLSHHIPKELRSYGMVKESLEDTANPEDLDNKDCVQLYCEFIRHIQSELIVKVAELRDSTLIYKLITALNRLPYTNHTRESVQIVQAQVKNELEHNRWSCKHLTKVVTALASLDAIDSDMLNCIIRTLELNQDNLDNRDIKAIIEVLERFGAQSSHLYISLHDKLEINKQISG